MSHAELDLSSQVLDLVRGSAGPAAQAEVTVDQREVALTRFANSFIHQNVVDLSTSVQLRLHHDGRTATGSTTLTTTGGLRALVERTLAAARRCPPDPGWPGLARPEPVAGTGSYHEPTATASPDERAARVQAFVAAAGGLETAGYCQTHRWSGAFANSAGQAVTGRTAGASMDGIARRDGADGTARCASTRLSDIDGAGLGRRAAAKANAGAGPVDLPPGRYEVVLEPTAVADLLEQLAFWAFNGKALAERRSFAVLGEPQFDPSLTLIDDGPGADRPGAPYDLEGTPKRDLVLVDAGITRAVAHDRRTAAKAGTTSTGNASPNAATYGPVPTHLRIPPAAPTGSPATAPPGAPVADASVAELVAGVRRGLLVTDLWYTRVLDPKSLVVTGLTRNGIWLVEDGAVTTPVRNFRFTQSYPRALAPGAVLGVGTRALAVPGIWATARVTAPALRLASWQFTGTPSG